MRDNLLLYSLHAVVTTQSRATSVQNAHLPPQALFEHVAVVRHDHSSDQAALPLVETSQFPRGRYYASFSSLFKLTPELAP